MDMAYILPGMRSAFGNVRQSFEKDRSGPVIHVALDLLTTPTALQRHAFELIDQIAV
jgi:hypothetical protein